MIVGEEEFLVVRTVRELVAAARAALGATGDGGGDLHDVDASGLTAGELTLLTSPSTPVSDIREPNALPAPARTPETTSTPGTPRTALAEAMLIGLKLLVAVTA